MLFADKTSVPVPAFGEPTGLIANALLPETGPESVSCVPVAMSAVTPWALASDSEAETVLLFVRFVSVAGKALLPLFSASVLFGLVFGAAMVNVPVPTAPPSPLLNERLPTLIRL